jgi:hypothetical protein
LLLSLKRRMGFIWCPLWGEGCRARYWVMKSVTGIKTRGSSATNHKKRNINICFNIIAGIYMS